MATKLSQVYRNRRNKRMGGKLGLRPPTLRNFFESVYIAFYNVLMDSVPKDAITMNDGTFILTSNYDYVTL